MIFDCFKTKHKDRGPTIPNEVAKVPVETKVGLRILMLPGHGENEGARTYQPHVNEAYWNRRIVQGVYDNYEGPHILFKDPAVWRKPTSEESYVPYCKRIAAFVKENKIDLVIEQHINAAGVPEAKGTENIISYGHDLSAYYANKFGVFFQNRFKIVPRYTYKNYRGIKAVSTAKKDRGAHFVEKCTEAGAATFLQEPFFGDYRTQDSSQFLDDLDKGIVLMVDFYLAVFKQI